MLFSTEEFITKAWSPVYGDGDDDGGDSKGGDGDGKDGDSKPTLKDLIAKHELQDEVNAMMSSNRKTLTVKNQELVTQLQSLRSEASLSTQAKEELEARIEELQTQFMSKEELAKRESEKSGKVHAQEIEKLTGDASRWQGLYAQSTVQRALTDAAIAGEAVQPSQIVSILGQNTQIAEEVDAAGQGKGTYTTVVKFNDTDSEGKAVVLDLSPKKAIERMRELPEHGNLFKGGASGGIGSENNAGGGGQQKHPKLTEILKDPAKYKKWRKENPDLDISKLRK